nr:hypothetical protein [uncultured Methanobacterium sp.]
MNKCLNSLPKEVQEIFEGEIVEDRIIEGMPYIYTYNDKRTQVIAKKLQVKGYEYTWYCDVVNKTEATLIGWTNIHKI